MVKKNRKLPIKRVEGGPIDCACVIHGTGYSWDYVDRLYNMLTRHISVPIRFHVYTEAERPVPEPYIKHTLIDWKISGPKKSWWYKMQLFNASEHCGPLLYFDLDTMIVSNIDWIWQLPLNYFWSVRDFKYLWRPHTYNVNSSVMWFDTETFDYVWQGFKKQNLNSTISRYFGDQDYINDVIQQQDRNCFNIEQINSWRWQCLDGGYHFAQKRYLKPNTGTVIDPAVSVVIFHGNPKPDQIQDSVVTAHWQ